jgi:hypothetical protein
MPQDIRKSASTLATDASPLELPPNALDEAQGVYIRRDGIAEPFVGGSFVSIYGNNTPVQLAKYGSNVLAMYRNGGTATCEVVGGSAIPSFEIMPRDWLRSYSAAEFRGNLYVTQSGGPQKLDNIALSFYPTGMPGALQPLWSLQTYGSSFANWLAVNGMAAYRICYRTKDTNGVVVRGAPSFRVLARNNAAGARGVRLTIPLPLSGARIPLKVGDVVEVYRSFATASLTIEPDDELYLAIEYTLTAADITAREITVDDGVADRLLGAKLYTSPSQEGALQENRPPPRCSDIEQYNRMMFYGDVRQPQFIEIKCRGTTNPIRAPFAYASLATSGLMLRSTSVTTTSGSPNVTLAPSLCALGADLVGSMIAQGAPNSAGSHIPASTYITSYNPTTGAAVMSANATATGGVSASVYGVFKIDGFDFYASAVTNVATGEFNAGTTSTPPIVTLESLCYVINRTAGLNVAAKYIADIGAFDVTQIPVASLILERNTFSASSFSVRATSGPVFFPALSNPFNGANTPSSSDEWPGAVFVSKTDQPEHVPPVNFVAIGDPKRRILRQIATASALWVFKEDGLFRVTGFAPDALAVELIDPSLVLLKSLSADVLDGRVYALTTRGPVVITDGGIMQLSDAIDGDTNNASPLRDQPQALASATGEPCFVTCDTSRRLVIFGINEVASRPRSAPVSYILNTKSGAWTTRRGTNTTVQHAVVEPIRGTLTWFERNLGIVSNQTRVLREWSSPDVYNPTQSYVAATLVSPSFSGSTVTVGAGSDLEPFFLFNNDTGFFVQNSAGTLYRCVQWLSPTSFVVDRAITGTLAVGAFGVREPAFVGWRFMDAGAPAIGKVWREVAITWLYTYLLDRYEVLFENELGDTATQTWTAPTLAEWSSRTGSPRRRMQTHRIIVPPAVARAALLRVRVRVRSAIAEYGLLGCSATFEPTSERVGR